MPSVFLKESAARFCKIYRMRFQNSAVMDTWQLINKSIILNLQDCQFTSLPALTLHLKALHEFSFTSLQQICESVEVFSRKLSKREGADNETRLHQPN